MTLGKLTSNQFLDSWSRLIRQTDLVPIKTAYKLKLIAKALSKETADFDEQRNELLTKYGDKDETGSLLLKDNKEVSFSGDNMQLFVKDINELMAVECVYKPAKISIDDLGDKVKLSVDDLVNLEEIID